MKHLSIFYTVLLLLSAFQHDVKADDSPTNTPIKKNTKKQSSTTSPINPYLQKILQSISTLPQQYQPEDTAQALKWVIKGSTALKAINDHKFFDACIPHNISSQTTLILQIALNTNDEEFWKKVHNDNLLQDELQKCNISYTKDNLILPNYNMLFRISYARIHIPNSQELQQFKDAYQTALICIQWYLFAQAIIQDFIFTSGMITIPDPEFCLFQFLDGYAELVSPHYRFYSGLHPHSLWQTQAYTQVSSTWKSQKQFNDSNFGIDLKNEQGKLLNLFPCNKSHLLFGILNDGITFIKWEDHGTTINFKEKDFSALKGSMKYFKKQNKDDQEIQRQEKIPQDVMLQFRSLYSDKLTRHQSHQIQTFGIKAMLEFLDKESCDFFTKYLIQRKKYNKDTLHMRKGNEIILQPRKFVTFG